MSYVVGLHTNVGMLDGQPTRLQSNDERLGASNSGSGHELDNLVTAADVRPTVTVSRNGAELSMAQPFRTEGSSSDVNALVTHVSSSDRISSGGALCQSDS
ncbi:hypothetical protein V6N13_005279 [Hibiscus sabdariffa]